MLCKVWGVGMFSIVALTTSNILLTLRLLHGKDSDWFNTACSTNNGRSWSDALKVTNHSSYLAFLKSAAIATGGDEAGELSDGRGGHLEDGGAFKVEPMLGRWDTRRRYKTHDHVFTGPSYFQLTESCPVCLATQTSVDRLYWLTQAALYWNAPISVAVFTPDVEYGIARGYLQYLVTCFPFLGEKINVHFTYPKEHPPKDLPLVLDQLLMLCDQPVAVLRQLLKQRKTKVSYNI